MSDEYVSNPRLAVLAEELQILNESLIAKGVPDHARIIQLRRFAEASEYVSNIEHLPTAECVEDETFGFQWTISFKRKSLGRFETPQAALDAYKKAHRDHYGEDFDANHRPNRSHLYDELPKGVRQEGGGFSAVIIMDGKRTHLGMFKTIEAAEVAYQNARNDYLLSKEAA